MRDGSKASYAAPAVEKAFEILEMLRRRPGGALVSEMAVLLDRSVGELFRIVVVLEKMGYLQRSSADDRYSVSYKLLDLAFHATPAQDVVTAAIPFMRQLASEAAQSCHLVVVNGAKGLVIHREQNPGTRGFSLRLGAEVNLTTSCSGQVLLAFVSDDERAHLLNAIGHAAYAPDAARLAAVRKRGYEQRKSAITGGVTDISFPVFGRDGFVAAALTIPFLGQIGGSQAIELAKTRGLLNEAATAISATLGHRPS
ncbi:IclR family transcriptional regulator [Sphingomonas sp. RIT328]|uniref:IclR family transcriptional regulator n=1 Tax=Sphingomonas sp. RIT328 TaxID=1470591 RepID=UPI00044E6B30|nr:IclR family transcriptional regulator [Sphingomonas sp. RIT328]EZP49989.1 IclR helix-turn-helix domain protein [Sphingomonas sp. RIT328]